MDGSETVTQKDKMLLIRNDYSGADRERFHEQEA